MKRRLLLLTVWIIIGLKSYGVDKNLCQLIPFNPFPDTIAICAASIELNAGDGYQSYIWSTGSTNKILIVQKTGMYSVEVKDANGIAAYDTVYVNLVTVDIIQPDTTICPSNSIELTTKTSFAGFPLTSIQQLPEVLKTSLLAFYPFNGNAKDASGHSIQGTAYNTAVCADRFGYPNNAFRFDGNSSYVKTSGIGKNLSKRTVSAWVKLANVTQGGGNVVGLQTNQGYFFDNIVYNETNNGWGFGSDNFNRTSWTGYKETDTTWMMITATYDDYSFKIFRNGQLIGSSTQFLANTYGPSDFIVIGVRLAGFSGGNLNIAADIDDVMIFESVLTAAEIELLYSTTRTYTEISANPPVFNWSTGEMNSSIQFSPTQSGTYTVSLTHNGITCKDSVRVSLSTVASFNPFSDTLRVCSDSILLNGGEGHYSYLWNTGDTSQTISVKRSGSFNVSIQDQFGCTATDQVLVSITKANILEKDTTICVGSSIMLHKSKSSNKLNAGTLSESMRNGLVAYYPFNGNANDESGYSNHGSVIGALPSTDRFGAPNSAYHFNGSSDFISCTYVPQVNNLSNYTMSAWIKLEGWNTNTNCNSGCAQFILSRDADNNSPAHFALVSGEAPGYEVLGGNIRVGNTDATAYTANNYAFPHTQWHMVTMTLGDGLVKLYIDGSLLVTNTCSHTTGSTSAPLLIGRNAKSDYPYFVNGNIDDVMLYARTLSPDEILQLYNLSDTQQQWSTGATSDSITVSPLSDTTYYFTVSNGISACVDSVKVHVQDLKDYNSLADSSYLVNGNLVLDAGNGFNTYNWKNNASQRVITVTSSGLYTVEVTSVYGCSASDSTYVFQRPEVLYIQRNTPTDSITGLSNVTFTARFTKPIDNVDLSDFTVFSSNNVQAVLSSINTIDDSTFVVELNSISGTGSLRLDLKSSGTGIKDLEGIDVIGGFIAGQSYWVDRDNPETSIQNKPATLTKNTAANFLFRSNEAAVRYEVSIDGAAYTLISDSVQNYSGLNAGLHSLNVRALDAAGNKDATPDSWSWKIDLTAPNVVSINRQLPLDSITNATTLTWRVRFSESVTGVDTADFSLTAVAPAVGKLSAIAKVSDSLYDISATVSNNTGGSLRLDLKSSSTGIADSATNFITSGFTSGQRYSLSNVSIKCPANITVAAATGRCNQTVAYTGANAVTVTGVTSPVITYSPVSGTAFNVGTTTVTATVKSGTTTIGTCSFTVTVRDAQLPTVSAMTVSPVVLAPADHTMKVVNLTYTATDNCTTLNSVVTVSSNEPDAGTGDGDLANDIVIVNNKQVQLRAEKTPGSAVRVYTITLTVKDAAGNTVVKTATVRVAHEILSPGTGSCYAINSTVPFTGQYWDAAGLTHTATWTADATSIAGTDVEPSGITNGTVSGSNRFTTAGVYKMKMNLRDNRNVTTSADLNRGLGSLITIFGNTGVYSYGGGCMDIPAGSLVAKPTVSGKASFGFTVSGTSATTGRGEVELDFRSGAWEFNTTTITKYSVTGAKLTMSGTGKVTGVATTYNYTLTAIDGNHPLGGGTDKVRLRVTTTAGAVIFDNNPGALATADPSMGVCVGLGQVYVPGGAAVGALETPRVSISFEQEKIPLTLKVSPNPSAYSFRIAIGGGSKEPLKMRLSDVLGRLEEERRGLLPNSLIEIGQQLKPGNYLAEFCQGEDRVVVKLVKIN